MHCGENVNRFGKSVCIRLLLDVQGTNVAISIKAVIRTVCIQGEESSTFIQFPFCRCYSYYMTVLFFLFFWKAVHLLDPYTSSPKGWLSSKWHQAGPKVSQRKNKAWTWDSKSSEDVTRRDGAKSDRCMRWKYICQVPSKGLLQEGD